MDAILGLKDKKTKGIRKSHRSWYLRIWIKCTNFHRFVLDYDSGPT